MCVSRALECCPSLGALTCHAPVCRSRAGQGRAGRENAFRFMTCTKFNFLFLFFKYSPVICICICICCHSSAPLLQWSAIFYLCLASLRGIELISMTRPLSGHLVLSLSSSLSHSLAVRWPSLFISRVHWETPLDFGFCVCVFNKRLSSEPSVSWPLFN